jgi:flagellum-specific ATP synthase
MYRSRLAALAADLAETHVPTWSGRVAGTRGLTIFVEGLGTHAAVGARLCIERDALPPIEVEIVAAGKAQAECLPFGEADGVRPGARATLIEDRASIRPSIGWLGRVVDGLGQPVDGKGALPLGLDRRPIRSLPPPAAARERLGGKIETGVAAIDIFTPLKTGQRLGLFSGSGVGKSVLMAMLARFTACDVAVIGLIGERGREVKEFIEAELGADGLAKSVVVVATSDAPALMRRQAALTTLTIAEHFRDEGKNVLCLMDSVTRFAMACREIGLAGGEPPTTKGYTPSVFAQLPKLLERAGPGLVGGGAITGLFTVLVDGDDHDEPIADAVRGILDGHVVLSRKIAEHGRYPAIDVLKSVSRTLPEAHDARQNALMTAARRELSTYADMAEMIRLGAYKPGANADVDRAIACAPAIEALITQAKDDRRSSAAGFDALEAIVAPL